MPKGPKGEKRPADVIGAAVKVMKIATGEIEEDIDGDGKDTAAVELGRKGGEARAKRLTKKRLLQEKKFKLTHYPAPAGLFFGGAIISPVIQADEWLEKWSVRRQRRHRSPGDNASYRATLKMTPSSCPAGPPGSSSPHGQCQWRRDRSNSPPRLAVVSAYCALSHTVGLPERQFASPCWFPTPDGFTFIRRS